MDAEARVQAMDGTRQIQRWRVDRRAFLLGAAALPLGRAAEAATQGVEERDDLGELFAKAGTAGTIVVHDHGRDAVVVTGAERSRTPYSPSSTFKILNTLLALQVGAASGMSDTFAYGGRPFLVRGKPFLPPACNATITLDAALRNSCIPVYQTIAGRIGVERYNRMLDQTGYGSPIVTRGNLRDFWLTGALSVSARDQVAFLDRLLAGRLPFEPAQIEAVASALVQERGEKGTLYAKTGYAFTSTPEIGWYVGWIAKDGAPKATFALNLDIAKPDHARARKDIALAALNRLGLW